MTVFTAERFKAADVAGLARFAKADVFGALHVGSDQSRDRARRGTNEPISYGLGVPE
jgi:hypothetical protein